MKKELLRKYGVTVLGAVFGIVGGFLYWKYVGCSTGACPITSTPWMSMLWGGLMGALLLDMFRSSTKTNNK